MNTVLAIITKEDQVLIGKLKAEKIKDFGGIEYVFPGGKVEENENLEAAALREVEEETGLKVKVVNLIGERVHPKTQKQIYYFHCEYIGGDSDTSSILNDDIEELIWIDKDNIVKYMPTLFVQVESYLKFNI